MAANRQNTPVSPSKIRPPRRLIIVLAIARLLFDAETVRSQISQQLGLGAQGEARPVTAEARAQQGMPGRGKAAPAG